MQIKSIKRANGKFSVIFIGLFMIQSVFVVNPHSLFAMHTQQDYHGQTEEQEDQEEKKCEKEEPECCPKEGGPVYLYNGEHYYTHVDLEIPGSIPIQLRRHYSAFSLYNAEFGYGWIMNYDYKLYRQYDSNLLLRRGCYDRDTFTNAGNGTYNGPSDTFETITENLDGTYTLNRRDHQKYQFDINGCLASIDDTNGNQLVFTYSDTKLPINGISPFSNITTPIVIGYAYRLLKIEQYIGGAPAGRFIQFTYDDNGRIVSAKDHTNREIFYVYDSSGNGDLISYIDAEGNPYNYTYNNHLMTEFVGMGCSDCGLYITEYDSNKKVTRQRHGSSVLEFSYLIPNQKTQVTHKVYSDSTGELLRTYSKTYEFDTNKNLIKEIIQYGTQTIVFQYTYNSQSLMTQQIDPLGNTTSYTYDTSGNLLTETTTLASGGTFTKTYTYNSQNKKTSEQISASWDAQTYRTEYTYYANGNLHEEKRILDGTTTYTTTYTYTASGNIDTITYPEGNQIKYEYNSYGDVTREYDPNNTLHQTLYTYDSYTNRTSITDANNNTTTFTYDMLNRLTSITNPFGEKTIYTWTDANLTQIEQGKTATEGGHVTKFTYDDLNRKTSVIKETAGGDIIIAQYTYDSEGNILSITDALGNTTYNTYDTIGRLASVADPLGNTIAYTYDKLNNLISVTDAESNTTTYQYNGLSRLTKVIQPSNIETIYTYNALGNVLTITDAEGHTTTNTYDRLGRLTRITDPLNHSTNYSYDGNDNLISKTDANGATITYDYDNYNQLFSVIASGSEAISFTYDNAGNLLTYNNGSYTYDALNRIKSATTTYPFGNKTISYTYDRFGNKKTAVYPDTGTVTYNYDEMDRLHSVTASDSEAVSYAYDNVSRITSKTLGNGTVINYTYDNANHLLSVIASGSEAISYTYDYVGNRLTKTDNEGEHAYTYDNLYRLISNTLPSESYTYDKVGNRLTSQENNDWTYNAGNQLASYNSTTFAYDNNGNTTNKTTPDGTTTYTWDKENRLTGIVIPAEAGIQYSYDPFGKRLSKTINGVTTWYLYDNEDIAAEYDNTGTLLRSYIHGQGIDEPVRMTDNATSANYYYLADGLGSITEIQDSSKNTVESYIYDSFGTPTIKDSTGTTITQSAIGNPYMFTCREWDSETQLYYYRARYYDARVGRFLSVDDFFGNMYNPLTLHKYMYSFNSPINYNDPFGYFPPTFWDPIGWPPDVTNVEIWDWITIGTESTEKWFEPDLNEKQSSCKGRGDMGNIRYKYDISFKETRTDKFIKNYSKKLRDIIIEIRDIYKLKKTTELCICTCKNGKYECNWKHYDTNENEFTLRFRKSVEHQKYMKIYPYDPYDPNYAGVA